MDIYVIRHAQAVDGLGMPDEHRALTTKGRRDAAKLGKRLRDAGVKLDAAVMSPLVRAVETASLCTMSLGFEGALEVATELRPSSDPVAVLQEVLLPRAELGAVALFGHQPQLSDLLEVLLHTSVPSLSKATAVRLRWDGPDAPGQFKWVLRPDFDEPSKKLGDLM